MTAKTSTAERVHALAELYWQGQVNALMEHTLETLRRQEAEACQAQLRYLQANLAVFERKDHQSSTEFYQQFQSGQTSNEMDSVE